MPADPATDFPAWGACRPGGAFAPLAWLSTRNLLWSGARRRMLAQIAAHPGPWLDTRREGFPVRFDLRGHPSRPPFSGCFRTDVRAVRRFLRAAPPRGAGAVVLAGRVLDYLPAALAADRPQARILALAPDPASLAVHRMNAAGAGPGRVESLLCVLGHDGTVPDLDGAAADAAPAAAIPSRPLLGLLDEHRIARPQALVLRCDGEEAGVLLPFLAAAPPGRLPDALVVATTDTRLWGVDLTGKLAAAGYRIRAEPNGWMCLLRDAVSGG